MFIARLASLAYQREVFTNEPRRDSRIFAAASASGSLQQQEGASPSRADVLRPVTERNGVAARRGREQLEVNDRSAGNKRDSALYVGESAGK
jgi:hypothetical protein